MKPERETILLVEDEAPVRMLVRKLFERHGYCVLEAQSGKAALEVWNEHGSRVDLLMTDMVMPDTITGVELAQKLKLERPSLKVIYCSGYGPDVLGEELVLDPGCCFLQKPFNLNQLLNVVRDCLEGHAPIEPASAGGMKA